MNNRTLPLLVCSLLVCSLLLACGPESTPDAGPTPAATTTTPPEPATHPGGPLPADRGQFFSASGACSACHTQMIDQAGNDVSTDEFWRGSIMANASRDPYWRAAVRAEVLAHPAYTAVIEDKCTTCHTPMARFTDAEAGSQGKMLDDGYASAGHPLHVLALDGVSCNLCHQIREEGLGAVDSFSGGYLIDVELPAGERDAFGPYPVADQLAQIMQGSSGFVPRESPHVDLSELCATCHTLYTPFIDAAGEIAGEFPEQMPYVEWQHSSYRDRVSCQDCHMPLARGGVQLSITGGPQREPFFQHVFVGGNVYMLEVLKTYGADLQVTASQAHFEDKQARTLEQMQTRTAAVVVDEATLDGSTLTASVLVANRTGHKLPTGFPSRRVWLHVTVADAAGQVVFESGAPGPDGAIAGNDNDADAAAYEPHYDLIDSPDQVQVYEAIMGDTEGTVTTTLLKGAGYLKDNRLLPLGFDKTTADPDVGVYGAALDDADFEGAADRVRYVIDVADAPGPFTVTARLLYQSVAYRWADNLRRHDAPEPAAFVTYYDQVPNDPVVVSTASLEVAQ